MICRTQRLQRDGPELTANALRDWCRCSGAGSSYIERGAPWENPYVESFNGRLRDELLAVEQFDTLLEAQVLIEDWRIEYNTQRPHSRLGWLAPATYAGRWNADHPRHRRLRDRRNPHRGAFEDFVDLVVPELQRRGIFRQDYTGTTLRDHLGPRIPTVRVRQGERGSLYGRLRTSSARAIAVKRTTCATTRRNACSRRPDR